MAASCERTSSAASAASVPPSLSSSPGSSLPIALRIDATAGWPSNMSIISWSIFCGGRAPAAARRSRSVADEFAIPH